MFTVKKNKDVSFKKFKNNHIKSIFLPAISLGTPV